VVASADLYQRLRRRDPLLLACKIRHSIARSLRRDPIAPVDSQDVSLAHEPSQENNWAKVSEHQKTNQGYGDAAVPPSFRKPTLECAARAVSHIRLDCGWQETAALVLDIVFAAANRLRRDCLKEQGIVSTFLNRDAREGLTVEAHGPYGQFYFDERQHGSVVLFAGGSGITPIMSMLRYIEETAPDTEIKLFYAVRTGQDIIFQEDLEKLQKRLPQFRCVVVASRPDMRWHGARGYVNRALIVQHLGLISHQTFFICGPVGFMAAAKEMLTSLGVRDEHILQERFTIAAPGVESSLASTCTVNFTRSGRRHEGSSDETLLAIAEKHGIEVPYSCRLGQCGTCATRVLVGEVEMVVEEGLESGLRAQGYRLLCVGHARGLVSLDA
jgi:ferredoxin-NADP reductase